MTRPLTIPHALLATVLVSFAACASSADVSAPAADEQCPLAHQPYSSNTVLIDLLINPAARSVLLKDIPELPAAIKSESAGKIPTFAAIVTPRVLASEKIPGSHISDEELSTLDLDLDAVKVDAVAARDRCARYDQGPPILLESRRHPAILVFSKIVGFRHESVDTAKSALREMGKRRGWSVEFTESGAAFNLKNLRQFDAIVWNNVSGDVLTVSQELAFRTYIEGGGGFAAFHGSGGDPYYAWDWYADTLIGARFLGHPSSLQQARVNIVDPGDEIVRGLPATWLLTEEWYSFKSNPRTAGAHILATIDETSYRPLTGTVDLRMGIHPIAWKQCIGNGRSFYTAIGHRIESYSDRNVEKLLQGGIAWAAGLGITGCRQGREVPRR